MFIKKLFRKLRIGKPIHHSSDDASNSLFFRNDAGFDQLYPQHIRELSEMHWTPLHIARKASEFLAVPNAKILDIGSVVGKFCIAAGFFQPQALFYGIEQRNELVNYAEIIKQQINLPNVNFIHGNLTQLDLNDFDHFYFYNSFYENIHAASPID